MAKKERIAADDDTAIVVTTFIIVLVMYLVFSGFFARQCSRKPYSPTPFHNHKLASGEFSVGRAHFQCPSHHFLVGGRADMRDFQNGMA